MNETNKQNKNKQRLIKIEMKQQQKQNFIKQL